jgi:hypothetical protein
LSEKSNPQNYLKLVGSGEVDETVRKALEDYVNANRSDTNVSSRKSRMRVQPPTSQE